MQAPVSHIQNGQHLWLSPERCVFWEEQKALILSDLHFGKTGHFRKAGIAVPQNVYKEDLQRLVHVVQHFQPQTLIVVGDMFHSSANLELELFRKWRSDFSDLSIQLIKGNHDILHDNWYEQTQLTIHSQSLSMQPFSFTHDVTQNVSLSTSLNDAASLPYIFSGHIHPGIAVKGGGRQWLRFPCFYFGNNFAVLPAFSRFTGTYLIEPKARENVFAIVENKIVQLQ
jgi:uncharacterized protein